MIKFFVMSLTAFTCAVASAPSSAQWWNPQDLPNRPSEMAAHMARKITLSRSHLNIARAAASSFASNEKWTELERMYDEFMASNLRATDGSFMVEAIQGMFADRYMAMPANMIELELRQWTAKVPQSTLRPVITALMWQARAWAARGSGAYASAPEEAMQIFMERMGAARKALEDGREAGQQSPLWWWTSLIVAGSTGMPPAEFDGMFEEATRRFPSYQPLYYTRMNYLLPQWGGSFEQVDAFVQRAVAKTAGIEGTAMYAWLYLDIARKTHARFESTQVS